MSGTRATRFTMAFLDWQPWIPTAEEFEAAAAEIMERTRLRQRPTMLGAVG